MSEMRQRGNVPTNADTFRENVRKRDEIEKLVQRGLIPGIISLIPGFSFLYVVIIFINALINQDGEQDR